MHWSIALGLGPQSASAGNTYAYRPELPKKNMAPGSNVFRLRRYSDPLHGGGWQANHPAANVLAANHLAASDLAAEDHIYSAFYPPPQLHPPPPAAEAVNPADSAMGYMMLVYPVRFLLRLSLA